MKKRQGVIILALVALLFIGQGWLLYAGFTSRFPGGNDFVARWAPGCALFRYGENPYSTEATLRSQQLIFGRPATPDEDQAPFFYPLHMLWFIAPFCLTTNYPLALAFWMSAMLLILIGGTLALMHVARWRPPRWLWALTVVWTVMNYPHLRALLLGQPSTLVFGALALALLALEKRWDLAAGICLAVATVKPQLVFLVIPWLLWWSGWARRWRVWLGLAAGLAILLGAAFLVVPGWPADFLDQVLHYDDLFPAAYGSLSRILTRQVLGLGQAAEWALTALAAGALVWLGWRFRKANDERWLPWRCPPGQVWMTGMVLLLGLFVAPQVATTSYPLLLVGLFFLFARWQRERWGTAAIVATELLLLAGQWLLFVNTLDGNLETAPVFLPLPLLLLAGLLIWRPQLTTHPEEVAHE